MFAGIFMSQNIVKHVPPTGRIPDLMIVLGGGGGRRVEYLAQWLMQKERKEGLIFMTGGGIYYGISDAQHMKKHAETLGVKQNILTIDTSLSTWDDAIHLKKYFKKNDITSQAFSSIHSSSSKLESPSLNPSAT